MAYDINECLKVYLGASSAANGYCPYGGEERLKQAYGEAWEEKLALIKPYLDTVHLTPDWGPDTTIKSETARFAAMLSRTFPELDQITVQSLASQFSYEWK